MISFKKISLVLVISVLSFFCAIPYTMAATGGVINFSGSVVNDTCRVDSDSLNVSVELGTVRKSDIESTGATKDPKIFDINIIDCPAVQGIQLMIDGDADEYGRLNVTGGAQGVKIFLGDFVNGQAVVIGKNPISPIMPDENGKATFKFMAGHVGTGDPIVPGGANATVTFEIVYP